ncbi:type III secretion chaperone SycN [Telmatospirillum sp. J64-1]|uniref:type III secretion chaperone SycN n=1 Tax=Telmatospirillum sp. J64-1 TaxID=2502183 RepID=UPI00115F399C|nr:type III secretion chaperone SycN [Telmatospirillum sp. J64-1]
MSWVAQTIAEFGRSIGIDNLQPDAAGLVQMAFDSGDRLCFEEVEDELLVYLIREVDSHDPALKLRALALCGEIRQWEWPVQAGLRGADRLVFLVRLPQRAVSLNVLEQSLDLLTRLHAMARG